MRRRSRMQIGAGALLRNPRESHLKSRGPTGFSGLFCFKPNGQTSPFGAPAVNAQTTHVVPPEDNSVIVELSQGLSGPTRGAQDTRKEPIAGVALRRSGVAHVWIPVRGTRRGNHRRAVEWGRLHIDPNPGS